MINFYDVREAAPTGQVSIIYLKGRVGLSICGQAPTFVALMATVVVIEIKVALVHDEKVYHTNTEANWQNCYITMDQM